MAAVFLSFFVGSDANAIVTSDALGTHTTTPGHIYFGLNLEGVALIGGFRPSGEPTGNCSATLITDRHLVTAAHCFDQDHDGEIDPLLFEFPSDILFETQDGWIAIDYDPAKVQWPDAWIRSRGDIAVVTLEADAPMDIPRYPLYGGADEIGHEFVLAGYGHAGFGLFGQDSEFDRIPRKRTGLNRYDAVLDVYEGAEFVVYDFDSGAAVNNALDIVGVVSDLGFGIDEVGSATGDSGGPGFLDGAIASVVSFGDRVPAADVTDKLDSSWGEAGFDSRVSYYRKFILQATDHRAIFVPEPAGEGVLGTMVWIIGLTTASRRAKHA